VLVDLPRLEAIGVTAREILRWMREGVPVPAEVAWLDGVAAELPTSEDSSTEGVAPVIG
jgi:hypothetical protein